MNIMEALNLKPLDMDPEHVLKVSREYTDSPVFCVNGIRYDFSIHSLIHTMLLMAGAVSSKDDVKNILYKYFDIDARIVNLNSPIFDINPETSRRIMRSGVVQLAKDIIYYSKEESGAEELDKCLNILGIVSFAFKDADVLDSAILPLLHLHEWLSGIIAKGESCKNLDGYVTDHFTKYIGLKGSKKEDLMRSMFTEFKEYEPPVNIGELVYFDEKPQCLDDEFHADLYDQPGLRYKILNVLNSCCSSYEIIDKFNKYKDEYESVCECAGIDDAIMVCKYLNIADSLNINLDQQAYNVADSRYKIKAISHHCTNSYAIIDNRYIDDEICTLIDMSDAKRVCNALNATIGCK